MGKIKKITENELVGGTQNTDVYPVTSVKAVYDENNERLDHILNRRGVINISTNYNADHIAEVLTLSQALSKVPSTDRVLGFQGKYLASDSWHTIIYTGDSLTSWSDKTKWIDLADKVFNSISKNATFAGIATPTTNPGTPDGPVFYIATIAGNYSNFGNIEVLKGETSILQWENNTWIKESSGIATEQEIIYDVSARNKGAVFESLQALLSSSNLNTLIPISVQHGGMSIRFIQGSVSSSDNKYVQYRLTSQNWSVNVSDWKNYDESHIILKSERTEDSTIITTGGLVKHNDNWEFFVDYYNVSELSGYVKIETTRINPSTSLYSLMDADNNVIAFSDKGTDVISEAFVDVTNGATLCVQWGYQTPCNVKYFNNYAITELLNLTNSAEKDLPVKNGTNLITSGAVYNALHNVLSGTNHSSKYIDCKNGSIVSSQYSVFVITEYDVTELTGFAHLTTSFLHDSVSLYSLQDENGDVISFSNKPTKQIADNFVDITLGTKLYVASANVVEFFDNDAIKELFDRSITIREDFDEFSNIVNYESLGIDISQYILWDKRITNEGNELEADNYAYVKLPISLFTVGEKYYFKGKSAQYVPGGVVQREGGSSVIAWGDSAQYTIQATDTYVCINLNIVDNLALARSICNIAKINKEVYSKSQTNDEIDSRIESIIEGSEYDVVEDNCEFYINKRFVSELNTPLNPPIDANGYVCAKFTNIDITKLYAADCISSMYVPGYMLLDENDIIIERGEPYTYKEYNKQVLPIKDNSCKTIILQAKVDTSDLNDVTVKGVLRLFVKEPLKNAYSAGEIDNKLYQRDVKIKDLEIGQQSEKDYKQNQNYWIGKSIAWFGTSIPEGGVWVGGPTYPNKVGRMLGVSSTHNEAVGGSCAANEVSGYTSFNYWYIRMGHSVAQNIDLFKDAYTVDYANQTVSNGPRTMIADLHLSSIPNITTYSQAVDLLAAMVGCSYEIKLVYRYLISDETESENYLNRIFSGYLDELNALKNISQSSDYKEILYQYDIDLIVFDHGHNDGPTPVENADFYDDNTNDIDTTDMSTWLGAMNTYMRLIMFYKPKMRIIQISDYVYSNTVLAQEQFARRWQIPYCEVWKSLPYLYQRFKVTVRGYWDASGIWHDKGFTWTEPTDMSDTNIANYTNLSANEYELASAGGYGTGTIGSLKTNINPRQENGEWVWDTNLHNIFMKDGLHPGSDYTWKCVDLYTRPLVQFIKGI